MAGGAPSWPLAEDEGAAFGSAGAGVWRVAVDAAEEDEEDEEDEDDKAAVEEVEEVEEVVVVEEEKGNLRSSSGWW